MTFVLDYLQTISPSKVFSVDFDNWDIMMNDEKGEIGNVTLIRMNSLHCAIEVTEKKLVVLNIN